MCISTRFPVTLPSQCHQNYLHFLRFSSCRLFIVIFVLVKFQFFHFRFDICQKDLPSPEQKTIVQTNSLATLDSEINKYLQQHFSFTLQPLLFLLHSILHWSDICDLHTFSSLHERNPEQELSWLWLYSTSFFSSGIVFICFNIFQLLFARYWKVKVLVLFQYVLSVNFPKKTRGNYHQSFYLRKN